MITGKSIQHQTEDGSTSAHLHARTKETRCAVNLRLLDTTLASKWTDAARPKTHCKGEQK